MGTEELLECGCRIVRSNGPHISLIMNCNRHKEIRGVPMSYNINYEAVFHEINDIINSTNFALSKYKKIKKIMEDSKNIKDYKYVKRDNIICEN